MDALATADVFLFEGFRLDRRGLSRRDQSGTFIFAPVGSRALEILRVLVERSGDLVTRDEIMKVVWPGTVVEDSNIPVQIAALRRLLDNGRAGGSCIQTIPGRGYRFVAPITWAEACPVSVSRSGNGTSGSIADAAKASAEFAIDGSAPLRISGARHRFPPAVVLAFAGALFLAGTVLAAVNLRSSAPWSAPARSAPRLSVVVLLFANLSYDPEQQYFADGITDDLTADLSRIHGMFVISRTSAFTYRGKPVDTKQVRRELGVRYVLEGSVQRSGNRVRITAQLIDAEDDAHLWAERFDRDAGDLPALQNEITGRIANTLNLELIAAEAARPTDNPDAMDYIFRGRAAYLRPVSRDSEAEAINLFEHALTLDPQSVEARTQLAGALAGRVLNGTTGSATADLARAEGLIDPILAARPRDGLAHIVKGTLLRAQNRFEEALPEFETALALNHNSAGALNGLAWCKLRAGSLDEAMGLWEQEIRLSPLDPNNVAVRYAHVGLVHLLQSRTDEAIAWLEKARSAVPALNFIHSRLAAAYGLKGETERAAAELAEARKLVGDDRFSGLARLTTEGYFKAPKVRALYEGTFFAGLRKAGVPEE
ncbi:MAG: winged helix-turn-helix domain-containing protein [Alphaproteobacteria bacterium]|nr:winged helix-turn-helix domain-containing protein [Alphaproteobacteria bacterium]